MLVISRKVKQGIQLPDFGMGIQVLKLVKGNVHLGIDAPKLIRVIRDECINKADLSELPTIDDGGSPSSHEGKQVDNPRTTTPVSHVEDRRLQSIKMGLNVLTQELDDANLELAKVIIEGLHAELDDYLELRQVVPSAVGSRHSDEADLCDDDDSIGFQTDMEVDEVNPDEWQTIESE